jgi:hypothetical protein
MIPSVLEKSGWVAGLVALYATGRISALDTQPLWPDLALGVLFVAALISTRRR